MPLSLHQLGHLPIKLFSLVLVFFTVLPWKVKHQNCFFVQHLGEVLMPVSFSLPLSCFSVSWLYQVEHWLSFIGSSTWQQLVFSCHGSLSWPITYDYEWPWKSKVILLTDCLGTISGHVSLSTHPHASSLFFLFDNDHFFWSFVSLFPFPLLSLVYASCVAVTMCVIVLLTNGFTVFTKGNWDPSTFVAAYLWVKGFSQPRGEIV